MPPKLTEAERRERKRAADRRRYWANPEKARAKALVANRKSRANRSDEQKKRANETSYRSAKKFPERRAARTRVTDRTRTGTWPKAHFFKCTDCDAQAQSYHHEDYSLWWSVEPLCHQCHADRHRKTPD